MVGAHEKERAALEQHGQLVEQGMVRHTFLHQAAHHPQLNQRLRANLLLICSNM